MVYYSFYYIMLIGYLGVSISSPDNKTKIIGVLLTIVNALIFHKG